MAHTVMEFTFIEFDKNWVRAGTVQYTATAKARLIVVAEDALGAKTTYWFQVNAKEVVLVSWTENLVYIPAKCLKRAKGDNTRCGR